MKILHIADRYPPYSANATSRQCRAIVDELAKRGHFNRVLTSRETDSAVLDRERAAQRCLDVSTTLKPRSFLEAFYHVRINRRAVRAELAEARPDVALIWSLAGLSSLPVWELQQSSIPTLFAVFDNWPRQQERDDPWYYWWTAPLPVGPRLLRRGFYATGLARLLRDRFPLRRPAELRFQHAFFASRALRESIAHAGFAVEGSEIIPWCISREDFPPTAPRRPELRRILWIGKLDADDDPMTAVQTIQELRHHGAMKFNLDLFGRGDPALEHRLHNYVRTAQLGGVVNIRHVAGEELSALFSSYDLLLHTARYPGPFPRMLLRAMAAQLPIVSTVEGSAGDVVRHGENAIAIRVGNPVDGANKILELAQDAALVARIAKQGYDDVLNSYAAPIVAGRIDKLLTDLVRQQAAPQPRAAWD